MDICLTKPKLFKIKHLAILFFALCLLFACFQIFYRFETKSLEETINDDLVWQEVKNLQIPTKDLEKLIAEIEGIKNKIRKGNPCTQYVLVALVSGLYFCEHTGKIYLESGEIWKIGKTCLKSEERYPNGVLDKRLTLRPQFFGTAEQCLIVEKVKLYAYVLSPENQKRVVPLPLPPGNKIFR